MPGCDFTRRDLLRWTAVATASPLIVARTRFLTGVAAAATRSNVISAVNLELVTLTEDRAVITWYTGYTGTDDGLDQMQPAPADGEVHWGTNPARLKRVAGDIRPYTPYHHVVIDGLEPGQTYYYQAFSNGQAATPTPFTLIAGNAAGTSDLGLTTAGPYSFTTPQPPPGKFLFSIALCNDIHMGETVAGLLGGTSIQGIQQLPGLPPYPEVMLKSLVADATALGAEFLLAAGDISAEAVPLDLSKAGQMLGKFGKYQDDYFVVRGNHDRAHIGTAYAQCSIGQWQGNDCFHDKFFPGDQPTYFTRELNGLRVIGIDTYDKAGDGSDAGALGPDQVEWFRTQVTENTDQPTMVFGHHPLVVEESPFPITPSNSLYPVQAVGTLQAYAAMPGMFLHHAGHTHRNHRTISPIAPAVTHQEIAAGKEYPGGFSLLRLYTGGFALNFYKSSSDLARQWSDRSRQEINGFWPQFALGASVSDRNTVVSHDLSDLKSPAPEAPTRQTVDA